MPPNTVTWDANDCDTSNGGFCRATCRRGYLGWVGVQCRDGVWSAPMGLCFRDGQRCSRQPPFTAQDSLGWEDCDTNEGCACRARCKDGYVGNPAPVSFCQKGKWTPVQGKCVPDPLRCPRMPTFIPTNALGWSWWCDNSEGSVCQAWCKDGYMGALLQCASKAPGSC